MKGVLYVAGFIGGLYVLVKFILPLLFTVLVAVLKVFLTVVVGVAILAAIVFAINEFVIFMKSRQ
jgi:hypothetical protein